MGNNKILLIDLSQTELRWCSVERRGAALSLRETRSARLPADKAHPEQRSNAIRAALAEAITLSGTKSPEVYAALPKHMAFLRVIEVPRVPLRDLRKVLSLRVMQEIPNFSAETMWWDFELLPESNAKEQRLAVISAVRRAALEEYLADFSAVGIEPKVLDVEPLAVARWFSQLPASPNSSIALVDVGHTNSSVSLIYGGRVRHFGQAPITFSDLARDANGPARFVLEVQTALHAFNGTQPTPQEIIVCGDERLSNYITDAVSLKLGARVRHMAEATQGMQAGSAHHNGMLIPANHISGNTHVLESLAFRAQSKPTAPLINLLPQKKHVIGDFVGAIGARFVSLPALIAFTILLAIAFYSSTLWMRERRTNLLQASLTQVLPLQPQLSRMQQTVNVLRMYDADRFNWLEILSELNSIKPDTIMLAQLKMEKSGKCSMQGEVRGKTPIQVVEAFVSKLNASPHFEGAQMGSIRPKQQELSSFQVSFMMTKARKGGK